VNQLTALQVYLVIRYCRRWMAA